METKDEEVLNEILVQLKTLNDTIWEAYIWFQEAWRNR